MIAAERRTGDPRVKIVTIGGATTGFDHMEKGMETDGSWVRNTL